MRTVVECKVIVISSNHEEELHRFIHFGQTDDRIVYVSDIYTVSNSTFQILLTNRSMARGGMTTTSIASVSNAIVLMGLSRNRENGARWVAQRRGMNGDFE